MRLKTLDLKNFKGIKSFTLDTRGGNVSVFGDNATGKTTLFDAFSWLLFDKDSANRKDFDIKTLTEDGQVIHGLDHEVEAVLVLDSGKELTLKKTYREKWTKKRGSAKAEFTGHTVDHFIDGVPVQKKEYDARIADIIDEETFKLLTNPKYFNEHLHWQKRRQILLEVCGDVSDAEVIASDKALARLPEILGDRSLEDHRKVIAARRAEINKELDRIPVRIDEVTQGLPELPAGTKTAYENELNILTELKSGKEREKLRIGSGGEIAEKRKALAELDAELQELKNGLRADIDAGIETEQSKIRQYGREADALRDSIERSRRQINNHQDKIKEAEAEMDRLRAEWGKVDKQEFEQDGIADVCPTCNRPLPADQVEEAREKALADFNREKAEELQRISISGKAWKARAEEHKEKIAEIEAEIADIQNSVDAAEADKAAALARLVKLEEQLTAIEQNEEYQRKLKERQALVDAIAALERDAGSALLAIEGELAELDIKILSKKAIIRKFDDHARGQARIEELKAEERKLAAEFEELEQQLYLTEEFIRAKVRMLEDKINSKFKMARFKLFEVQVNGALAECCETTFNGVPYGNLNNGARLNIGLDIINTLSEHYGFEAPIFVDNREAVTRLIPTRAQLISLVVSEKDKTLRVECDK